MMGWVAMTVVALSAWAIPQVEVEPPQPMQVCREGDAPEVETYGADPERTSWERKREDVKAAVPKSRLPNANAYIATGAVALAVGTAMKVPAPLYWEVDPQADPFSGASTLRAGMNSSIQGPGTVALGTLGTVFQAVGVGLLRRGVDYKRSR